METTYGDRRHRSLAACVEELVRRIDSAASAAATSSFQPSRSSAHRNCCLSSRRPCGGAAAAQSAGLRRFAHGDVRDSIFRRHTECLDDAARQLATATNRSRCRDCATHAPAEIDGDQPYQRRSSHHCRLRHVHRWACAPPPHAQPRREPQPSCSSASPRTVPRRDASSTAHAACSCWARKSGCAPISTPSMVSRRTPTRPICCTGTGTPAARSTRPAGPRRAGARHATACRAHSAERTLRRDARPGRTPDVRLKSHRARGRFAPT